MINPIAARIKFPKKEYNRHSNQPNSRMVNNCAVDFCTFGKSSSSETKVKKSFLEILFGNEKKKRGGSFSTPMDSILYSKPKNEQELREFIEQYQPMIKW